jgi:hypothetical protein
MMVKDLVFDCGEARDVRVMRFELYFFEIAEAELAG